jgi:hypothetical protein
MSSVDKCLMVWGCLWSDLGVVTFFETLKIIISSCHFRLEESILSVAKLGCVGSAANVVSPLTNFERIRAGDSVLVVMMCDDGGH